MKKSDIGEKLYRLREKNGLTQDELAEKLNVSRQTISNWENNKVKIDLLKASELCLLYGVSMDDLAFEKKDCPKDCPKDRPENGHSAERDRRRGKFKAAFLLAVGVLSILSIAAGVIFCALGGNSEASSTILLTERAAGIVLLCFGILSLGATLFLLIKSLWSERRR